MKLQVTNNQIINQKPIDMSHRTLNLSTFFLPKEDSEMKKALVSLFDEDYNGGNGAEYWELSDQDGADGEPIPVATLQGFETEAERFIDEIFSLETDDQTNIENVLDKVEMCYGSHVSQFQYVVEEAEGGYSVAIAYLS